jgi:hypothetical protein
VYGLTEVFRVLAPFLMPVAIARSTAMFGPYRAPPESPPVRRAPRASEELVLAWLLVALGAVRVAAAIAGHETWGLEASLAALMLPCGLAMLVRR